MKNARGSSKGENNQSKMRASKVQPSGIYEEDKENNSE